MTATLVLTNGRLLTLDEHTRGAPPATAVAIRDNRIMAVGSDADMRTLLGPGGEWIDLRGRAVTPGLVDAHVHFQWFSLGLQRVDLDGAPSKQAALQRITDFLGGDQPATDRWLQGRGWQQDQWPERRFPTAADLDAIVPNRPVYLSHKSGHAAWVNSLALRLCGIDAQTEDPPGGKIVRDVAGNPTGILLEDAMSLVSERIPRPTIAETVDAMRAAQAYCWRVGLTGIHDFDGRDCFLALQSLREQGELGLRFVKNVPVYRADHAIGVGLRSGFGDEWIRIGGVKIFADGALGPKSAAMLAPYENEPDNRGIVVTEKEEMMEISRRAAAAGLSITIHAIGDRANHDVLDVYEVLRREETGRPGPRLRHRIEHVQVLHPTDVDRLAQLNVIASMQPIHATSDLEMADRYWGERAALSYAWRTVKNTGALLVFGSDAPVESIDPRLGLHAAITRRRVDGTPGPDGWRPEQKLSLIEAIHGFTLAAAMTAGQAHEQGSITPGKLADLTIFDTDIFDLAPDDLPGVDIAGTVVGGRFRHRTLG